MKENIFDSTAHMSIAPAPSAEGGSRNQTHCRSPHLNFPLFSSHGDAGELLLPPEQPYSVWLHEREYQTHRQIKTDPFYMLGFENRFLQVWMDVNNCSFPLYRNNLISDPLFWEDAIASQGLIQKFLWLQGHPRRHLTAASDMDCKPLQRAFSSKKMQWCFNYKSAKSTEILEKIKQCAFFLELWYQIKLHNGSTLKFFPQIPSLPNIMR